MEKTIGKKSEFSLIQFLKRNSYILSAVLVFGAFYLINPRFLSMYSLQTMASELAPLLPLACGIGFILYTGCIDLSIGTVASLICVLTGTFVGQLGSWIIPLMIVFGVLIGVINGSLVSRLKLPAFIVTLCAQSVYRAAAIIISGGKSNAITGDARGMVTWATDKILGFPLIFWVSLILLIGCVFLEKKTELGKSLFAIGANERAARLAGVDTAKVKTLAFVLCSLGASIGGVMYAYKLKSSNPVIGDDKYMRAISAVALGGTLFSGGKGGAMRTLIGVMTVTAITSGMNMAGVDPLWMDVVFGAVLILAVTINSENGGRDLVIK